MSATETADDESAPGIHVHVPPGHEGDAHDAGVGGIHATLRDYLTGFALAVILTAIPFWLVMSKALGTTWIVALILLSLGAVQIVVHMIYFLHMNARSEGGWTFLALIFTMVLVVITLAGSLWVMYHLNQNMMPMTTQQLHNLP